MKERSRKRQNRPVCVSKRLTYTKRQTDRQKKDKRERNVYTYMHREERV